jgi:hypothetical protein
MIGSLDISLLMYLLSGGQTDYVARTSVYHVQQLMVSRASKGYSGKNKSRNRYHLKSARCWEKNLPSALPVLDIEELSSLLDLNLIETNPLFIVSSMTYSRPLLRPKGEELLNTIATSFQKNLSAQGLSPYRVVVTSGTRSIRSQAQLEKVNDNAASESAHWYGYTFDISFGTFVKKHFWSPSVDGDVLKKTLDDTLSELRREKNIWVIAERGPSCFHITLRCP